MTANTPQKNLVAVLFLTVFLTACGGGGDSDSSSTSANVPDSPQGDGITESPTSEPIDSAPIIPTDKNNEPDNEGGEPTDDNVQAVLSANNQFSLARTSCGLNGLSVDTELNDIAVRHANYIKYVFANSVPTSFNVHFENEISSVTGTNNPFFGGLDLSDRLVSASYPNSQYGVTENIAQSVYYSSAGSFLSSEMVAGSMAKSLLAAPYHLRSLMLPTSSVIGTGMAVYKPKDKTPANNQGYVLVSNASATKTTATKTLAGVLTYPCQDVTGTVTALYNETPSPVKGSGRNLRTDPIGQPVYINMPSADTVKVSNVKFRDVQRNIDVPIQLLDFDNDPYKGTNYALPTNEAFILPLTDALKSCESGAKKGGNCGLYGNSKYKVSFDILIDNETLEKQSFIFTTGKVNY
ncbi:MULTISPECIES: CAP domain-containing protein [unclassified Psychrobacter]|uniref:CAP domain-containing protein n=1 Tax=unclassified Psychrobacter TaxID=196806 RepID=UPI0025B2A165|nr:MULTISPECIES: CAP domain-containing protein [unclassified Psychrobacter]MDN3452329.1 CAP domain-containing protein [Psychrobacter sp. APC 3350]MDN3502262.1 CAP domain-containing protein [Psychrobacter sp. 5A.1]